MNRNILIIIGVICVVLMIALVFNLKKIAILESKVKKVNTSISGLLTQAKEAEAKGDLLSAKSAYQKLVSDFASSEQVANWQKKNEELNIRLIFSPAITPKSVRYEIKPGDILIKIAREFKTTPELIQKSNALVDDKILPGRKIKVSTHPGALTFVILVVRAPAGFSTPGLYGIGAGLGYAKCLYRSGSTG